VVIICFTGGGHGYPDLDSHWLQNFTYNNNYISVHLFLCLLVLTCPHCGLHADSGVVLNIMMVMMVTMIMYLTGWLISLYNKVNGFSSWSPMICVTFIAGYKGNLMEHVLTLVMSLVFTITSFVGFLYLLLWQTYVLRADVILTSIEIVFIGLETIFCIVCIIVFSRYTCTVMFLLHRYIHLILLKQEYNKHSRKHLDELDTDNWPWKYEKIQK